MFTSHDRIVTGLWRGVYIRAAHAYTYIHTREYTWWGESVHVSERREHLPCARKCRVNITASAAICSSVRIGTTIYRGRHTRGVSIPCMSFFKYPRRARVAYFRFFFPFFALSTQHAFHLPPRTYAHVVWFLARTGILDDYMVYRKRQVVFLLSLLYCRGRFVGGNVLYTIRLVIYYVK